MKMRSLLLLVVIAVFANSLTMAQQTPPAPSTPPAAPTPATPAPPMNFSFLFEGSGYLGIVPEDITRENMSRYGLSTPRGVGISRVTEGSPAEKAGLKKGDIILQFDGDSVTSNRKLLRLIGEAGADQSVRLNIVRNGSEQQLNVTLGQREDGSRTYGALTPQLRNFPQPPNAPQVWGNTPEAFSFAFGSNRRVGVTTTALTKQLADYFDVSGGHGLLVTSVSENSPAAKAGLKAGDVITEMNGEKLEDTDDFIRALNRKHEGEVTLTIIRDKSQRTIKVTPERRQAPSFNLSDLQGQPTLGRIVVPRTLLNLPNAQFGPLPRIETFVMPKLDNLSVPNVMTLPRIRSLLNSTVVDFE